MLYDRILTLRKALTRGSMEYDVVFNKDKMTRKERIIFTYKGKEYLSIYSGKNKLTVNYEDEYGDRYHYTVSPDFELIKNTAGGYFILFVSHDKDLNTTYTVIQLDAPYGDDDYE